VIHVRRILILTFALALTGTACSQGSPEVASYGDTVITEKDLAALYEGGTLTIDQGLRGTLFNLIARAIITDAVFDDFGETIDQTEVDGVEQAMVDQMTELGMTPAEFFGVDGAGEGMTRHNATISVIREVAQRNLTDDPSLVEQILADPAAYTTVCAAHILVASETEGDDVMVRLEDGEEFGAIADELSLDSSVGGDLGCRTANTYTGTFAEATLEAPIDEPYGPFQTEFGWHVVLVRDRTEATAEAVAADPRAYMTRDEVNTLWTEWLSQKLQDVEVTLDPRYGTWTAFGILAPGE
jgi:parvulin-like peptidyl-prolyl isomerase